jgi:hypothetical protein
MVFGYRFSVEKNARLFNLPVGQSTSLPVKNKYKIQVTRCEIQDENSIEYRVRERENTKKVARCKMKTVSSI